VIPLEAKPRLADKVKLRLDKKTNQQVLLYPEKGLVLNRTGSSIAELCTGEHSVDAIVERLVQEHEKGDRAVIEPEVLAFLEALLARGLLRLEP
jgi:pyrroloquinoline quinone biosynthesis protein D